MDVLLNELKKSTKDLSVLYVEDEDLLRKSVEQYLNKIFLKVDSVTNGKEALECYFKNEYDLVITDINMPYMDGIEMASKIREKSMEQNIIIISAHSEIDNFIKSIQVGIDGYILKPIDFNQMNTILYKVASKINRQKENEFYKEHLEDMIKQKVDEIRVLNKTKVNNYKKTLYALIDIIERRDTYTGGHSQRVAKYSKMIAEHMGFSAKECKEIYQAGILHDIGKVAIPDSILLKPNTLNEIEYSLIQKHVSIGYEMLKNIPMFSSLAEIIKSHHERYDGSGYPDGLKKDEIPIAAQIMAVADTFDAMTTSRIYKGRKSVGSAIDELKELSDIHHSKDLVYKATEVLKEIRIDSSINQLPNSELEKERFSFFYKDQITGAFNKSYLDLVLFQNSYNHNYHRLYFIEINNFNKYNNKFGWEKGDVFLKSVVKYLNEICENTLIFRVYGDDFVVISQDEQDIKLDKLIENTPLEYNITQLELNSEFNFFDMEKIAKSKLL